MMDYYDDGSQYISEFPYRSDRDEERSASIMNDFLNDLQTELHQIEVDARRDVLHTVISRWRNNND